MITFCPVELNAINHLRDNYLTDIRLSQELMLEWLVAKWQSYSIVIDANMASRRTLEKCGFVSKHCIIQFKL